jgi:hypothetical protein
MCGQSLSEGPKCRSPYVADNPPSAVFHSASLHADADDLRDWYLIGCIAAASSLAMWLVLLGRVQF